MRVFNPSSAAVEMTVERDRPIVAASRTNLREQPDGSLAISQGRATVTLGPRKILTVDLGA